MVPLNRKGSWGMMAKLDLQGAPPQHKSLLFSEPVLVVSFYAKKDL